MSSSKTSQDPDDNQVYQKLLPHSENDAFDLINILQNVFSFSLKTCWRTTLLFLQVSVKFLFNNAILNACHSVGFLDSHGFNFIQPQYKKQHS